MNDIKVQFVNCSASSLKQKMKWIVVVVIVVEVVVVVVVVAVVVVVLVVVVVVIVVVEVVVEYCLTSLFGTNGHLSGIWTTRTTDMS